MSMIDFIILGLVIEKPMSSYEINKVVELRNMSKWVKISLPSIYKNTPKLEAKGFLTGKSVREGLMPEKKIYSITDSGYIHFGKLLDKFTENLGNFNFQFTPVLMNLVKLKNEKALEIINRIELNIQKEAKIYEKGVKNLPPEMAPTSLKIIDLYGDFYSYLAGWIKQFRKAYIEEQKLKEKE